ncbi:hypothetical protein M6B38_360480 [Iris pallida]|uniref:Uncharacterized protein n=1 Tax=Iris pallida TaxID=29817 RepID=A0AAX6E362_IRIPA|nr:hypothetical protein M6B38_212155 [Iris pallida]KAJ6804871.1 hypothetical protein M6B38_185180 [Iris pallida]KAJ6820825.1 hypothetical protein M6B38_395575 [Iris pallida]KAJ6829228.1 hypothetical protein M6B38_360480 [Iris pallida]
MYGYFTVIFPNHFMDIVGVVAKAAAMNPGSEMVSCCSHMRNGEAEDYYITSENEDKKYDFEFKDHTWLWFETTWYLTNSIWFYGISKILMISIIFGLFLFP